MIVRWYDFALKGKDNGTADEKPVQLFILNRNEWIGADAWPLPETQYTPLYLNSKGNANTVNGDGYLSFDAPVSHGDYRYSPLSTMDEDEESGLDTSERLRLMTERLRAQQEWEEIRARSSDQFVYDPRDPVMSLMHQNSQSIPMDQVAERPSA